MTASSIADVDFVQVYKSTEPDDFELEKKNLKIRIILRRKVSDSEAKRLADFASRYETSSLVISDWRDSYELNFLREFPFLDSFYLNDFEFRDFDELSHIPAGIRSLTLGETRSKRLSLQFLAKFQDLEDLGLEGHKKHIETVGSLAGLRSLYLRSITLDSLEPLLPLSEQLQSLDLKLGGTKNLGLLPLFKRLRYFEAWLVRGLSDLSMLGDIPSLQFIFLQALKNVTVLPDMSKMSELRRLVLETMKGLYDLSPIRSAPNLQEFAAIDMGHLLPQAFEPLIGHPTLEVLVALLGSTRKNKEVEDMFGLTGELPNFDFVDAS